VTIAVLLVITAALLVVLVLQLARSPGGKVQLGTNTFSVGGTESLAKSIESGGPLLFQTLRGNELDIYVQHLGTDPASGWLAFAAHAPNQPRSCILRWNAPTRDFTDPCTGVKYPSDGSGLTMYGVTVDSHKRVVVDLRQAISS
jgi:hypothetical protein